MDGRKTVMVAVEGATFHFDQPFTYLVPPLLEQQAAPGVRVLVPFGRGNRNRQGIIMDTAQHNDTSVSLKEIFSVLDDKPLLSGEMIALGRFMKEHTFCTLFDAYRVMFPTGMNLSIVDSYSLSPDYRPEQMDEAGDIAQKDLLCYLSQSKAAMTREQIFRMFELTPDSDLLERLVKRGVLTRSGDRVRAQMGDATVKMARPLMTPGEFEENGRKFTKKQQAVLSFLLDVQNASVKEVCYFTGVTQAVVQALEKKDALELYEAAAYRNPYDEVEDPERSEEISLSSIQDRVFHELEEHLFSGQAHVSLLYGITGSGKTSVYLSLIDRALAKGENVIVMVPEIALTPQTLSIFHKRYGRKVAVLHSGLSIGERMDEWKRIRERRVSIAIGTRSAVFAPFDRVGLIIMDEEQEHTYKSEGAPRFHAREIAKFRCHYHNSLLLLASATPAVESYYHALNGKYTLHTLDERYGASQLPDVDIVDMQKEAMEGNKTIFSRLLVAHLSENLARRRQSILLLNRRGYHTYASCTQCGHTITCPHCSISMTYHKANNRLMCHYCGYSAPLSEECPQCHARAVRFTGLGTQKAQAELEQLFPTARILRMDTDTTMSKFAHEEKLGEFAAGKYDMMIGTQMVAKGLDFPAVTLVGVLNADQSLYSDDFRSYERTFSLLTQVVGRAGRGQMGGTAVIQTYTPDNEIIKVASRQEYPRFYESEILTRRALLYPPFCDMAVIGLAGEEEQTVVQCARELLKQFRQAAGEAEYRGLPFRVMGPSPASVLKVNNKYRYKLIIKCRDVKKTRDLLGKLLADHTKSHFGKQVTVYIDMNPVTII